MPLVATGPYVRERVEELEWASLSTWATLAAESKGRDRYEEPDAIRTAFQLDRDRIRSTGAFRALAGKAAQLPSSSGWTRLDETLEVATAARTLARALRLNEDLAEAVALGHALGSTAFADAGVEAFDILVDAPYDPPAQAVRIVECLADGRRGLNLTWETRDGILGQSGAIGQPATCEGQVVDIARRWTALAARYRAAVTAGPGLDAGVPGRVRQALGDTPQAWFTEVVQAVVTASSDRPEIRLTDTAAQALDELTGALTGVGEPVAGTRERQRAIHCFRSLAVFELETGAQDDPAEVVDHLVALTDAALVSEHRRRFEPS